MRGDAGYAVVGHHPCGHHFQHSHGGFCLPLPRRLTPELQHVSDTLSTAWQSICSGKGVCLYAADATAAHSRLYMCGEGDRGCNKELPPCTRYATERFNAATLKVIPGGGQAQQPAQRRPKYSVEMSSATSPPMPAGGAMGPPPPPSATSISMAQMVQVDHEMRDLVTTAIMGVSQTARDLQADQERAAGRVPMEERSPAECYVAAAAGMEKRVWARKTTPLGSDPILTDTVVLTEILDALKRIKGFDRYSAQDMRQAREMAKRDKVTATKAGGTRRDRDSHDGGDTRSRSGRGSASSDAL